MQYTYRFFFPVCFLHKNNISNTSSFSNLMILTYKDNIPATYSIHRSQQHSQRPNQTTRNPLPVVACTRQKIHSCTQHYTLARFSEFPRKILFFFFFLFCTILLLRCVNQAHKTLHISCECENEKYSTTLSTGSHNSYVSPAPPIGKRCYGTIKADYW